MAWHQISIAVDAAAAADAEELLTRLGALSFSLEDAGDQALLEPAPGETPLWNAVRMGALFDEHVDRAAVDAALGSRGIGKTDWKYVEDRAWERVWLDDFKPVRFGDALWVCPHGQTPADAHGAAVVHLDPGLAFGTGRHATTAMCLEWLATATLEGKLVVDYGCGSGLLAIAAIKLGARAAIAVDIDEQALVATRANARANGVGDRVQVADGTARSAVADVLVANILAGTLAELVPTLAAGVRPGGNIVLSGILEEQAPATASLYARWFDMDPPVLRAGWARLSGRRNDRVHTMS